MTEAWQLVIDFAVGAAGGLTGVRTLGGRLLDHRLRKDFADYKNEQIRQRDSAKEQHQRELAALEGLHAAEMKRLGATLTGETATRRKIAKQRLDVYREIKAELLALMMLLSGPGTHKAVRERDIRRFLEKIDVDGHLLPKNVRDLARKSIGEMFIVSADIGREGYSITLGTLSQTFDQLVRLIEEIHDRLDDASG